MIGHGLGRMETCLGAGILYAQDKCPIMNQHHDRAFVLGVWIAKHISNPDFGAILKKGGGCSTHCVVDWPGDGDGLTPWTPGLTMFRGVTGPQLSPNAMGSTTDGAVDELAHIS